MHELLTYRIEFTPCEIQFTVLATLVVYIEEAILLRKTCFFGNQTWNDLYANVKECHMRQIAKLIITQGWFYWHF